MKLKHYLIASPENDYQPWILSKTALACLVLSVWALRLFLPGYIAVGAPGMDDQDLMNKINSERTSRFLPALITNSKLSAAAIIKSSDMIDRDYFAHVNPDGDYVWPVIEAQGYKPYQSLGENLAVDFTSAEAVVNAWMNSPGHRANILNEKFQDQGMGAVFGNFENHDTYLITNLFGTLLKKSAPPPAPTPVPPPGPSQAPVPSPTPVPKPSPTPSQTQTPNPVPVPVPVASEPVPDPETQPDDTSSEPTAPVTATTGGSDDGSGDQTVNGSPVSSLNASDKADLSSLKMLLTLFAALYAFFLAVDSIIIHRAKVLRQNISSSPHAVVMILIALVNAFTLWI